MSFVKIFYQRTEERENKIQSIGFRSSDFDQVLIINITQIETIHYGKLDKILEVNLRDEISYLFHDTSEKIFNVFIGCLEN